MIPLSEAAYCAKCRLVCVPAGGCCELCGGMEQVRQLVDMLPGLADDCALVDAVAAYAEKRGMDLREARAAFEFAFLKRQVHFAGSLSGAARRLGIHRNTATRLAGRTLAARRMRKAARA